MGNPHNLRLLDMSGFVHLVMGKANHRGVEPPVHLKGDTAMDPGMS